MIQTLTCVLDTFLPIYEFFTAAEGQCEVSREADHCDVWRVTEG